MTSKTKFASALMATVGILITSMVSAKAEIAELHSNAQKDLGRAGSRGDIPAVVMNIMGDLLKAQQIRESLAVAFELSPLFVIAQGFDSAYRAHVAEGFAPDEAVELALTAVLATLEGEDGEAGQAFEQSDGGAHVDTAPGELDQLGAEQAGEGVTETAVR